MISEVKVSTRFTPGQLMVFLVLSEKTSCVAIESQECARATHTGCVVVVVAVVALYRPRHFPFNLPGGVSKAPGFVVALHEGNSYIRRTRTALVQKNRPLKCS